MSNVTKEVVSYTAQRVTFSSSKPMKEVSDALERELNTSGSGLSIMRLLATATSKEEIVRGLEEMTEGTRDFVLFAAGSHSRWLSAYHNGAKKYRETHIYTIGNPILGEAMLSLDLTTGLHIPPKFLVLAREDGKGTDITYDLMTSVADLKGNEELRKAAQIVDDKLEAMVKRVLA